tara:strand:+ start:216 stop:569 length:354 start_codon:yes stop_codon:yes gene_type:complete
MATISKVLLGGSTQGKGIKVTGTSTGAAVTVHTAVSGTTDIDEIWLWAANQHTGTVELTIEWGGTAADDLIVVDVAEEAGLVQIAPGIPLQNGLVIKAFANQANVINIFGFVNRLDI